jgi:hypothetical protein
MRVLDREVELVLIRSTPSFEGPYSNVLVRTTIPADSEVRLAAAGASCATTACAKDGSGAGRSCST